MRDTTNTTTIYDTTTDLGGLVAFGRAKRSGTQSYTLYNGAPGIGFAGDVRPFAAVFAPKDNGGSVNDLGDVTSCPY